MNTYLVIVLAYLIVEGNLAPTAGPLNEPQPKRLKKTSISRCNLQFSEVKIAWNTNSCISPFIELKASCPTRPGILPQHAISNYLMIVVQSNPLALNMVVFFETFPYNGINPFIVIGSPDVPNVHISTSTPHVQSIFSRTENSRMFPIPAGNSYAIFLLKDLSNLEKKSFNLYYNSDGLLISRRLTTDQIKLISNTAVDMVVLGDTMIEDFEYIWNTKTAGTSKPNSGRSWSEIKTADIDSSLSICVDDYNGFDSAAFEVKHQSPGEKNLCSPLLEVTMEIETIATPEVVEPSHERKLLHSLPASKLLQIKNSNFNPEWVGRCQSNFPKRSKLLEQREVQEWLNFVEDSTCRFTCKACQLYRSIGFRPDVKSKPNIVTNGFFSSDVHDNGNSIKAHLMYPMHDEAVQFYNKIQNSESDTDVLTIIKNFEDKEMVTFNATMNVVLIAYAEIKAGLSFQNHEALMKAFKMTGANVGSKHHTGEAAQSIATVIAKSFRHKMLQQLVTSDQPFAIMVDSSTSFNLPFLAVYIQVLEDDYPVTHFYSLIYMQEGETAKAMTDSFIKQIKQDDQGYPGFEKFFKSRLAAIASDGASVMVGSKRSFKILVSEYVGKTVPNIVCLSHKLDSAYKAGIKVDRGTIEGLNGNNPKDKVKIWQFEYFQSFEKSSNELYSFYASRGYKKWMHLVTTAEELGIVPRRMKYVFEIRWSESHYQALETVHHNYYAIVEDLDQLRIDRSTDEQARSTAGQHYNRMTDKTYVVVLHEFLDILTTFKIASKKFQESSSTVVGKVKIVYNVLNALQEYKFGHGPWIKDFLKTCACFSTCDEGDCTLDMYDDCTEVTINGLKLVHNFPVALSYTYVRTKLYDNLIASVKKYFDLEMLDAFQIFNPQRINFEFVFEELVEPTIDQFYTYNPQADAQVFENNKNRIQFICRFYTLEDGQCKKFETDWTGLLSCLIRSDVSGLKTSDDSSRFWPLAMSICPEGWTDITKHVLGLVLVTPFSSSEVERGFSVMNSVKTKGRARLDKNTLDSVMAVRINGPDVADFNAYEYTIQFLKQFARVDDDTFKGGRKPAQEMFPSMMKKSRIY